MDTRAASVLACEWHRHLAAATAGASIVRVNDAPAAPDAVADLASRLLADGERVLILVSDDELLPQLSGALDLAVRPLCLVLPAADFAARIALRATLSLLRSRLARDGDDEQTPAWCAQRERIAAAPARWQAAMDWNASNTRAPWPADVAQLFPVCILPLAAWRGLPPQPADTAVFFRCHPGVDAIGIGRRQLHIGAAVKGRSHAVAPGDDTVRLSAELAQLTQDVGELELELATAQAEMADFTHRYYRNVGRRLAELDALQARLARARAQTLAAQTPAGTGAPDHAQPAQQAANAAAQAAADARDAEHRAAASAAEAKRFAEAADAVGAAPDEGFRPSTDVKKLFRQLAQKIHPDRAVDDADRLWRTQLMAEANRAYRAGDGDALRDIAITWQAGRASSHGGVPTPAGAVGVAVLQQQIARMRARFDAIKDELNRLFGSRLYELFLAARQALRHGRDLLQDMADRLDAQIADLLAALGAAEGSTAT